MFLEDNHLTNIILPPIIKQVCSNIDLPGSKSIANRVLLISAITNGTSIIHNISLISEDITLMINALNDLGVRINIFNKTAESFSAKIDRPNYFNNNLKIFCGNSGTTIRFLSGILSILNGSYHLYGIERMHNRPIADLVTALKSIGANIQYINKDGFPPIHISKFIYNNVNNIKIKGSTSSQYTSSLFIALAFLNKNINVEIIDKLISKPYINITIELLKKFNYNITYHQNKFHFTSVSITKPITYFIEPDATSATYFMAIGAINGKIVINNLSSLSLQGDTKFVYILQQMGANIKFNSNSIEISATKTLNGITINMEDMPDAALTLAVMAIGAKGRTIIYGLSTWKNKESNRLIAMKTELTKLGAIVEISDDSINIYPPENILPNIEIDTYNDHRVAMSFSIISAFKIPIIIKDIQCVNKTFANYFTIFNKINY